MIYYNQLTEVIMKTKVIADMIYNILKNNNVDFKEFYVLSKKELGWPEDSGDFHMLIVVDNGRDLHDETHNIYELLEPIYDDFEVDVAVIVKNEDGFKTSPITNNFVGMGVHCVA